MPKITTWNRDYDFKFEWYNKNKDEKPTGLVTWCFYLEDNVVVRVVEDLTDNKNTETKQFALRECKKNGLQFWNEKESYWQPYNRQITEAYSNFIAEREILEK